MKNIRWAIQDNLGSSPEIQALQAACVDLGIEVFPVTSIPFSTELPDIPDDKPTIFYGSARFVALAHESRRWSPCAFWDDDKFRYSSWREHYQDMVLNHDGNVWPLGQLASRRDLADDEIIFVRPDRDLKEFAGQLMSGKELRGWIDDIAKLGDEGTVTLKTDIVLASPKTLQHEWRLFMVSGRYCSGSHYRRDGVLNVHDHVPPEVAVFAERVASVWQPADAFVIDVGFHQGALKVIELNGLNSTGFYASDIKAIVRDVSTMTMEIKQPIAPDVAWGHR